MQAIVVKYLGPTNCHGSRYKATAQAGSVILEADDRLNEEENARAACDALLHKLEWHKGNGIRGFRTTWVSGFLPDGSAVFVNPTI